MAIDFTSPTEVIRRNVGWYVGDALELIERARITALDDAAAQALCLQILHRTQSARDLAVFRLTSDSVCLTAFELFHRVEKRLRERPAGEVTADWLRTTASEIDTHFGDDLQRLSNAFLPPPALLEFGARDEHITDAYRASNIQRRVPPVAPLSEPEAPPLEPEAPLLKPAASGGYLGLNVDEIHGEVFRAGKNGGRPACFQVGSAMWHWFIVAYHAGSRGATKEQVDNGYPKSKEPVAMRQARANAQKNLRVLGIGFEDRFPLRLVATD